MVLDLVSYLRYLFQIALPFEHPLATKGIHDMNKLCQGCHPLTKVKKIPCALHSIPWVSLNCSQVLNSLIFPVLEVNFPCENMFVYSQSRECLNIICILIFTPDKLVQTNNKRKNFVLHYLAFAYFWSEDNL